MSSTNALTMLRESIQKIASAVRTLVGDETAKYKFVELPDVISEKLVSKQKAIDAINATKTVGNGYVCEDNGMIVASVRAEVTNHDNSWDGTVSYGIYKNGKAVKTGSFHVDGWDKGSGGTSASFTVVKGDTVSYSGGVSSDAYIGVTISGSLSFTPNPF